MEKFEVEFFESHVDVIVVGHNPEMADLDNPHGKVYGYASFVKAVAPNGATKVQFVADGYSEREVAAKADRLVAIHGIRLDRGLLPVDFRKWKDGRAMYGTPAYLAECQNASRSELAR